MGCRPWSTSLSSNQPITGPQTLTAKLKIGFLPLWSPASRELGREKNSRPLYSAERKRAVVGTLITHPPQGLQISGL